MGNGKPWIKTPTLKDIAGELGISAMAVSKALNDKGGIGAETVLRIKDGLPKLKDVPKEMGGSGEAMAE